MGGKLSRKKNSKSLATVAPSTRENSASKTNGDKKQEKNAGKNKGWRGDVEEEEEKGENDEGLRIGVGRRTTLTHVADENDSGVVETGSDSGEELTPVVPLNVKGGGGGGDDSSRGQSKKTSAKRGRVAAENVNVETKSRAQSSKARECDRFSDEPVPKGMEFLIQHKLYVSFSSGTFSSIFV